MKKVEVGMLAKSLAGHDKDQIYVILQREKDCVYLADGRLKTINKPKKKNIKHMQVIGIKHDITGMDDVGIKRILTVYDKEMRGE